MIQANDSPQFTRPRLRSSSEWCFGSPSHRCGHAGAIQPSVLGEGQVLPTARTFAYSSCYPWSFWNPRRAQKLSKWIPWVVQPWRRGCPPWQSFLGTSWSPSGKLGMDPRHGRHAFRAPSGTGDALAVFV